MRFLTLFLVSILTIPSYSQNRFILDARPISNDIPPDKLGMGGSSPNGSQLQVNSRFITFNKKPILPVMGEVHYSRIPRSKWEEVILKMKACGVNIIASYVIWIHHEETEGVYDWSGNKSLREFAELCQKNDVWFYPRIGPWVHAEVRNGGTPDWILSKDLVDRSNNPLYQSYVKKWYEQISFQLNGLMFKDGGPIIGIQLENEYARGTEGEDHIRWLKQTAIGFGMISPMYTVTGWGNASVPENEVIPLWGAYPDEPWAQNINRSFSCKNFTFSSQRDDENIGNSLKKRIQKEDFSYPYFTCEMGIGIQNTDHRRLQINKEDGLGLMMAKLGSGSNLIGYYVFAGGNNPVGKLSTLEENREYLGYWNTNPMIEYDFQAAIRGSGKNAPSYNELKRFHYFLNEYGDRLAPMMPVFQTNDNDFHYAMRTDGKSGFLFGINFCRHVERKNVGDARFEIQMKNKKITFPEHTMQIPDSAMFIWPLNFALDNNVTMQYATAQPICRAKNNGQTLWIFSQTSDVPVEIKIRGDQVSDVSTSEEGHVSKKTDGFVIYFNHPIANGHITITDKTGSKQRILLVSEKKSHDIWILNSKAAKHVFFSSADLVLKDTHLSMTSLGNEVTIQTLDAKLAGSNNIAANNGAFDTYQLKQNKVSPQVALKTISILKNAEWLRSSVERVQPERQLFHRFFKKQLNIASGPALRSVRFYFFSQAHCQLQINGKWVAQNIKPNSPNILDLTGYILPGENDMILDFPLSQGNGGCIGKIVIEFENADIIEFPTDDSWVVMDSYTFPAARNRKGKFVKSDIIKKDSSVVFDGIARYEFSIPSMESSLNNQYLNIDYVGSKAQLYNGSSLIADNFNNQDSWQLGLNRLPLGQSPLRLDVIPLNKGSKIYFDVSNTRTINGEASVTNIQIQPEYKFEADLIE